MKSVIAIMLFIMYSQPTLYNYYTLIFINKFIVLVIIFIKIKDVGMAVAEYTNQIGMIVQPHSCMLVIAAT